MLGSDLCESCFVERKDLLINSQPFLFCEVRNITVVQPFELPVRLGLPHGSRILRMVRKSGPRGVQYC